jgi:hypothetical protein
MVRAAILLMPGCIKGDPGCRAFVAGIGAFLLAIELMVGEVRTVATALLPGRP